MHSLKIQIHMNHFHRALVFIACTLGIASTAPGQNLIANGGFESGFNVGWSHIANNGGSAIFSEETTDPKEGTKALKIEVTSLGVNVWNVQSLGPTVSLTTGSPYRLTFWAKASAPGNSVRMVMQDSVFDSKTFNLGTDWTQYTWDLTAKEASPSVRINYLQTGSIWMDDIRLEFTGTPAATVTISPEIRHQSMVGFGGALSWFTTRIYAGSEANDAALEKLLFQDSGIDVLRLKNWYYPANYPSSTDPQTIASSDIGAFNANTRLFAAAKAANPDIQVLLSSWSPPANLKSNSDRKNGGTLAKDASGYLYDELAQYWVDCLDHLGWTPDYLSFQNEPGWVATWESCIFRPTETATNAGYAEAADAIWDAIKDRSDAPKMLGTESENIGNSTWSDWNNGNTVNTFSALNTPLLSRPYFAAHGYHIYNISGVSSIDNATEIGRFHMVRDSFGERPNWMTEFSKSNIDWFDTARVIHNTIVEANASAYIYWKLAWQDATDAMIVVNADGSYEVRPHYYTIKHYAKHVSRGDRRIEVAANNANLRISGYLAADGASITLVAINLATTTQPINLSATGLPILSLEGFQSVTGNFDQPLAGLDKETPIQLPAESLTTLVLHLPAPVLPQLELITDNNEWRLRIPLTPDTETVIEHSIDLIKWFPLHTFAPVIAAQTGEYVIPMQQIPPAKDSNFFRAKITR